MKSQQSGKILPYITIVGELLFALVANVATNNLPQPMHAYIWIAWPLVICLALFQIIVQIKEKVDARHTEEIDDGSLQAFIKTVNEAEELAETDQRFLHSQNRWEEWEDLDKKLLATIIPGGQKSKKKETVASLVIRLTKVLLITLPQGVSSSELISLLLSAYEIAKALKCWHDAAFLAYEIATIFEDNASSVEAEAWADEMELCIKQLQPNESARHELSAKWHCIKGIALYSRDTENISIAREHLEAALREVRQTNCLLLRWRVANRLGALEKGAKAKRFQQAKEYYEEALQMVELYEQETGQAVDSALKLDCYQALGDLAFLQEKIEEASGWYEEQLQMANRPKHMLYKGRAFEGLAECLVKKDPGKATQAYQLARSALAIEQDILGTRENRLLKLLVRIADIPLLQAFV